MNPMYQIKLTPLAKAFAHKMGGEESLLARARIELTELDCDAYDNGCPDIFFHTLVALTPDGKHDWDGQQFICTVNEIDGEPGIIIDTATPEESDEELKEGPFKGFKINIPRADSSD